MKVEELRNEFEIGYNAIASMSSPGLDSYEISVFLTKAQLELVKDYYNTFGNKYQDGFEASEKRRQDLKELVKDYKTAVKLPKIDEISTNSQFFEIPANVFLPIYESVNFSNPTCPADYNVNVYVKTHDEYNIQISNPFKRPDSTTIWRLDSSNHGTKNIVELINPRSIGQYNLRYIKYPSPIIIEDLINVEPGLSIDGISVKTECELREEVHREIIDRAIELALRDYKPEGLSTKVQLDQRNE